jgi:hypothetical protein
MRKRLCIAVLFMCLSLSACAQADKFTPDRIPEDISRIEAAHILCGQTAEWTLEGEQIDEWRSWLHTLSAKKKVFKEGNTPGDSDGGEVYTFTYDTGSLSYIINGEDDCYLLLDGIWYAVLNPSDPFPN